MGFTRWNKVTAEFRSTGGAQMDRTPNSMSFHSMHESSTSRRQRIRRIMPRSRRTEGRDELFCDAPGGKMPAGIAFAGCRKSCAQGPIVVEAANRALQLATVVRFDQKTGLVRRKCIWDFADSA